VRDASNGQAALDELIAWKPTAIILDLMMPIMDGWTFRQQQRALGRADEVPVVVLSASRHLVPSNDLAAAALVAKPFDLDALIETLDELHRQHV
jgi:DNA-binding response OmpR family regulator